MNESAVDRWLEGVAGDVASVERVHVGRFTSIVERLIARDAAGTELARAILKRPVAGRRPRIGESFGLEARSLEALSRIGVVRVPELYAATEDPQQLVMEDVPFRPVDFRHAASLRHGLLAMTTLARLHGALTTVRAPSLGDGAFRRSLADAYRRGWRSYRAQLVTLVPGFERIGDSLVDEHEAVVEALAAPACMLHGDAHFENMPLQPDGNDVVMFDWQGPRLGHPALDVACFVAMSYRPAARRSYELELIERHHREIGGGFDALAYYRLGLAVRAAQCVELVANAADPTLISHRAYRMVARRCLMAAAEQTFSLERAS